MSIQFKGGRGWIQGYKLRGQREMGLLLPLKHVGKFREG